MSIKTDFRHTIAASYIGYITQAIVNNFAPLLFVTFHRTYGISLSRIGLLVTINFVTQILVAPVLGEIHGSDRLPHQCRSGTCFCCRRTCASRHPAGAHTGSVYRHQHRRRDLCHRRRSDRGDHQPDRRGVPDG